MEQITLVITNRCNFRCKTCLREHDEMELDFNLLVDILDQFKKLDGRLVRVTGGEPALHDKFKDIINEITNKRLEFSLVSNGSMMGKYGFLLDNCLLKGFTISIDGSTQLVHDHIREQGSFQKALDAIVTLKKHEIKTIIQTCVNTLNINQLTGIARLADRLKVNELAFLNTIETPENRRLLLSDEQKQLVTIKACELNRLFGFPINTRMSLNQDANMPCRGMIEMSELTVNPFGELVFCCDIIGNGVSIDSLTSKTLQELSKTAIKFSDRLAGSWNCTECNKILAQ